MRWRRAAPRLRTRFAAICIVLGLAFIARAARAEATFALSWRPPTGAAACVTEAAVRTGVEKKLGRDPFTDRERADIVIEGEEARSGARFRARVTQRDRNGAVLGARDLDAESCSSLIRTTTIVVALFIEPGSDGGAPEDSAPRRAPVEERVHTEERRPTPEASPQARPRPMRTETPAPPRKRLFELSLGVGGAAAVGLLPSASAALRVLARLESTRSRWSFEWSAGYSLPQTLRDGTVRGTFSAIDQQLRACLSLVPAKIGLDACGGVFWGAVIPSTRGVKDADESWRPIAGPVAAAALQLGEGKGAARLDLGLAVPPLRRSLYYLSSEGEPQRFYATGRVIVFVGLSGLLTIL